MKPLILNSTHEKFVPGLNDVASKLGPIVEEWDAGNECAPNEVYYRSNKTVRWNCHRGHQFMASPKTRASGADCGQCWKERQSSVSGFGNKNSVSLRDKYPDIADELVDPKLGDVLSQSSHKSVDWRCTRYAHHHHTYELSPNQRLQGRSCTYCSLRNLLPGFNDIVSVRPDLEKEIVDVEAAKLILANSKEEIEWHHVTEDGVVHRWSQSVCNRVFKNTSCTVCLGFTVQVGVNDFGVFLSKSSLTLSPENTVDPTSITLGSNERVALQCEAHNPPNVLVSSAKNFTSGKAGCQDCRPKSDHFTSRGEREVAAYVREMATKMGLKVENNVRRFKGRGVAELDVLVPEKNLAIDFNGTYWHEEGKFKPVGFHAMKRKLVNELGFTYIEVWENDWRDRREAVKLSLRLSMRVEE